MSMAEASPPAGILPRCVQVCAQPEKIAAPTALVLAANFRKSRLEIVDHSLSMAYLLSVSERPVKPFRNLTLIGNRRDMKNLTLGEMAFSNVDGDAKVLR